ncbi:MAG: PBP1A family penicillin-binding protein [Pseudomonadota bacterium]
MTLAMRILSGLRLVSYAGVFAAGLGVVACVFLVFLVAGDLPKLPDSLDRIVDTPRTEILAAGGEELMTIGGRNPVPLTRVSPHFINAVVATEDHLFWEHHGMNKLRTLKALAITLVQPGRIQGASTITQQLAKNLFFSFERSWSRKLKELLIAFQIEATSSKAEILHTYINQIYFGAGASGIEKASQVYFNKPAAELTLGEAALLAGIPKSPTRYNPFQYYDRALNRRSVVLGRMAEEGYISSRELEEALATRPVLARSREEASRPGQYFLDAVITSLVDRYGEEVVFQGGITVTTTLDPRLQVAAETAMKQGLSRLDTLLGINDDDGVRPQGALVAVDPASGAVRALIGGRDYSRTEFNRAVNSRRQPGSGFKPFVYYTALSRLGLHGGSLMTDGPVSIPVVGAPDWAPLNFERTYRGPMILKSALTYSVNTIAAKLVARTGPEAVIKTARACGIESPLDNVYSVALGTSGVTPLEMASAFGVFAAGGTRHESFLIQRVDDHLGRVMDEHIVRGVQVLDPSIAFQVVDMMRSVIDRGSGSSIRKQGFSRPAAGKTGTTDSYNDAWFTGFTPSLCACVWTGFDVGRQLKTQEKQGLTGGVCAAPIWADFMTRALENEPVRDFAISQGIRFEPADAVTGCPPVSGSAGDICFVPLKPGQALCKGEVR